MVKTSRPKPSPSGQETSRDADNRDHMFALQLQLDINNEGASMERAAIEQQRYQMEDRRLAAERKTLAAVFPMPFQCGICLDDHPMDSVARITQCEHPFCRTCLRDYVRSKLSEHIYPIFCPICVAEQGTSEPACAFSFVIMYDASVLAISLQLSMKASFACWDLQKENIAFSMNCRSRHTQ